MIIKRNSCYKYLEFFISSKRNGNSSDQNNRILMLECHANKVFHFLAQNLLERLDKCWFLYEEIEFLDYIISQEDVHPNDHEINVISNFSALKNIRDMQSFLRLSLYFRKFIENLVTIASPLHCLKREWSLSSIRNGSIWIY